MKNVRDLVVYNHRQCRTMVEQRFDSTTYIRKLLFVTV